MYVARLGEGYIVKRMPNRGSQHAPDCSSYEPPPELSGLGQVMGSAITEDPATGETMLKLDFPLSKIPGRSTVPSAGGDSDSVATDGSKLSLRGLLHYLWDQAELTRWQPGFAGKRSWATVRKQLLQAAEHKFTGGHSLLSRLYIPEVFSVEQRDAINARRLATWTHSVALPGKPQPLMLLIAEVKEVVPARYGYKAVVKHVPDQAFAMDEPLYRRLGRRFETELSLWGATDSLHMMTIATFKVSEGGVPTILELSLMPVTRQWLPVENAFEHQLLDWLVHEDRAFIKALRYNLSPESALANAILVDVGSCPVPLFIGTGASDVNELENELRTLGLADATPTWLWHPDRCSMPVLPERAMPTAFALSRQTS